MPVDDVHAGERHVCWLRRLSPSLPCSLREARRRRGSPPCVCWQRFWGFGICCALGFLLSFGVRAPAARRPALALALAAVRRPPLSADVDGRPCAAVAYPVFRAAGREATGLCADVLVREYPVDRRDLLHRWALQAREEHVQEEPLGRIGHLPCGDRRDGEGTNALFSCNFFPAQPVAMAFARSCLLAWMTTSKMPRGGRW